MPAPAHLLQFHRSQKKDLTKVILIANWNKKWPILGVGIRTSNFFPNRHGFINHMKQLKQHFKRNENVS